MVMSMQRNVLLDMFCAPERVVDLSISDWSLLVRQARRAGLLPRLANLLEQHALLDQVPKKPAAHLHAGRYIARRYEIAVRYEIAQLQSVMNAAQLPLVLLKGAAYVAANLPVSNGRVFADFDILVPKNKLHEVENEMLMHGWVTTHHDEYDQRYYRTWMHELPPMRHGIRQTVVDIHHTILPETARLHPDPKKLMADAVVVEGEDNTFVLAPVDMVLHSATHLFHDGELEHGMRDLVDLDLMLRDFGNVDGFWDELVERAAEMDLARPLFYALRYTHQILQTPVPGVAMKAATAVGKPAFLPLMDALFSRALMPDHPSCDDLFTPLSRRLMYIRSHFLRMPLHLLIPHLLRKAFKRKKEIATMEAPEIENQ